MFIDELSVNKPNHYGIKSLPRDQNENNAKKLVLNEGEDIPSTSLFVLN